MVIKVDAPVTPVEQQFRMSFEESVLVDKIFVALGRVAAIRVTRAFTKCDLRSAYMYVNSLKGK